MSSTSTPKRIKDFRLIVGEATSSLTTRQDLAILSQIPNSQWDYILQKMFRGDIKAAKDACLKNENGVYKAQAIQQVRAISAVQAAATAIAKAVKLERPMLMISDIDTDGATAQSIALTFKRACGARLHVQPKEYDSQVHGFSVSQIDVWSQNEGIAADDAFCVIVSDLGSNQKDEQQAFHEKYPHATLIIIDHHTPSIEHMVDVSEDRTIWVSPHAAGGASLSAKVGGGVSAGYLTYIVFSDALSQLTYILEYGDAELSARIEVMKKLGEAANLLDHVECDTMLKPMNPKDIKSALELASLSRAGRSIGRWLRHEQSQYVTELAELSGDLSADDLLLLRMRYLQLNHCAQSAYTALMAALDMPESEVQDYKIQEDILRGLSAGTIEDSASVNYITQCRGWLFYLSYEAQISGAFKREWLDYMSYVLKEVAATDREVLNVIRRHQFVKTTTLKDVQLMQPVSPAVEQVFSSRELNNAYKPLDKSVMLTVIATHPDRIGFRVRMDGVSAFDVFSKKSDFQYGNLEFFGNHAVGGLTLHAKNHSIDVALMHLITHLQTRVDVLRAPVLSRGALLVTQNELSVIGDIFRTLRLDVDPFAAPVLLIPVKPYSVFENYETKELRQVHELARSQSWETVTEKLDFAGNSRISIPIPLLKSIAEDGYSGALEIALMPNGTFLAKRAYTGEQLKQSLVTQLSTANNKYQKQIIQTYKRYFANPENPVRHITRDEVVGAIHFTNKSALAVDTAESIVLSVLRRANASHWLSLDVESVDDASAHMTNIGLYVMSRNPSSALQLDRNGVDEMLKESPYSIRNIYWDGDVAYVNEDLERRMVAKIIGADGDKPILVTEKSSALTSLTAEVLMEVGEKSNDVNTQIMNFLNALKKKGDCIFSAHNLPFDNSAMSYNFPDIYEFMSQESHCDTALLAKRHQLAYSAHMVSVITNGSKKIAFANNPYYGFNLSSKLDDPTLDKFTFPSIKGDYLLKVNGQEVVLYDRKSTLSTVLKDTRDELAYSLRMNMGEMISPQYSIQKFMHFLPIISALKSQMPVNLPRQIAFNGYGLTFDQKLWSHIQSKYPYDRRFSDVLSLLRQLPEVREFFEQKVSFESEADVPLSLEKARMMGSLSRYDLKSQKFKKPEDEAAFKANLLTFTGEHIFRANLTAFLSENQKNADQMANAWLYELILKHNELNTKELDSTHIKLIGEEFGVDPDIVENIYKTMYRYRQTMGTESFKVHETHNNADLDGDVLQEIIAVLVALSNKMDNPFISREYAIRSGIDFHRNAVDALYHQVISSTLLQQIRNVSGVTEDGTTIPVNVASGLRMQKFSQAGVSTLVDRLADTDAQFRCSTLSAATSQIKVNCPDVSKTDFVALPMAQQKYLEGLVELSVTAMVLSNSLTDKTSSFIRESVLKASTHPVVLSAMTEVGVRLGNVEASSRKEQTKKLMGDLTKAIIGEEDLSMSANKDISPDDMKIMFDAVKFIVSEFKTRGFESAVDLSDVEKLIKKGSGEYYCMQRTRETGEKCVSLEPSETGGVSYEPLDKNGKSMNTRMFTSLSKVPAIFMEKLPALSVTALSAKDSAIDALLFSPMTTLLMNNKFEPDVARRLALRTLINQWIEDNGQILLPVVRRELKQKRQGQAIEISVAEPVNNQSRQARIKDSEPRDEEQLAFKF